ncbi:hypothetical protein U713_02055 [Rhodobacter capsulatus YW2]|nr:hypothetical protein U713_02055 [Rhodobacter capsulatus YW2]
MIRAWREEWGMKHFFKCFLEKFQLKFLVMAVLMRGSLSNFV